MGESRFWSAACLTALLLLQGCGVRVPNESKLVFRYSEGIWNLHQPTYRDDYLACHPDEAEKDLGSRVKAYEAARKTGKVTFSPDGVEIIKLGALGNGAYFQVHDSVTSGGTLRFNTILRPDYININFNEFPPNAILYILGAPLGAVVKLRPGKTPGPEREVLQSVDLQWIWTRLPEGSPAEWCLKSILPDPKSATFKKIQFRETPMEPPAEVP